MYLAKRRLLCPPALHGCLKRSAAKEMVYHSNLSINAYKGPKLLITEQCDAIQESRFHPHPYRAKARPRTPAAPARLAAIVPVWTGAPESEVEL